METIHPPTMPENAGWTVPQIMAALALKSLTLVRIAKEAKMTHAGLRNVIRGRSKGLRCRMAVAKALDVPVEVIWPDAETKLRRYLLRQAA